MRRTNADFSNSGGRRRLANNGRGILFGLLLVATACADPFASLRLESTPIPNAALRPEIATIAFGSCNDAFAPQPLWSVIGRQHPDVFLWTGDIVYADIASFPPLPGRARYRFGLPRVATVADLRAHYALQKNAPAYAALRRRTRILGIYDDHDYGQNNAGRDFVLRAAAQKALLDFLDEAPASPRRSRAGAYAAYDFGTPAGPLRIVLLDTRYHREVPGPKSDVLGESQWRWLRRQLSASPARFHWLVSSIQVLPEEHPYEGWARFPAARKRLLELLQATRPAGLAIISGDRHLAEISRMTTARGLELLEITSSGLTHSVPPDWREPNRFRTGDLYGGLNFGLARFRTGAWQQLEIRDQTGQVVLTARIDP